MKKTNALDLQEMLDSNSYDLLDLWRETCDFFNYVDDYIYDMEDFMDMINHWSADEILSCAFYGRDFNPNDEFAQLNGYGNFSSSDYLDELDIDIALILEFLEKEVI